MRRVRIILVIRKKILYLFTAGDFILFFSSICLYIAFRNFHANVFIDPQNGVIAIDPGHGGIDGGTNFDGILEKDINLAVSKKLKDILQHKGYKVVMTREEDISLDKFSDSGGGRHQRDLDARADIINESNAQLFLSIHVNSNVKRPETSGSILYYNSKYEQNRILSYCIQRALNNVVYEGRTRTIHDPVSARFFLLEYCKMPGAIVETGFLSNDEERKLLCDEKFQEDIAKAIAYGMEKYMNGMDMVIDTNMLLMP